VLRKNVHRFKPIHHFLDQNYRFTLDLNYGVTSYSFFYEHTPVVSNIVNFLGVI
jgi:hypothetical protein